MAKLDRVQNYAKNPQQWAEDNNNAAKQKAMENAPLWQQFGFSSEQAFNNIYNPTANAPAPGPAPLNPADPFGDYLSRNPSARDAWAYLQAILDDYGLGELAGFVKENLIEGRSDVEIQQRLREQPVYKKRFAAIEARKQAGLPPMSETEVVEWERAVTQIYRRADIPQGLFDSPDDFVEMLKNDWSVAEVENVVNEGFVDAQNSDPLVRQEIERLFGPGTLTAFFIDPDRTQAKVMAEYQAAKLGAQARFTGYGQLTRTEAETLAGLGITEEQARTGFGTLTQNSELFDTLPGQQGSNIDRQAQLDAAFRGDVNAQQRIERVGKERANVFDERGGFATSQSGFSGLGRAR